MFYTQKDNHLLQVRPVQIVEEHVTLDLTLANTGHLSVTPHAICGIV